MFLKTFDARSKLCSSSILIIIFDQHCLVRQFECGAALSRSIRLLFVSAVVGIQKRRGTTCSSNNSTGAGKSLPGWHVMNGGSDCKQYGGKVNIGHLHILPTCFPLISLDGNITSTIKGLWSSSRWDCHSRSLIFKNEDMTAVSPSQICSKHSCASCWKAV